MTAPTARTLAEARAALFDALNVDEVLSVVDADGIPLIVQVFDYEPDQSTAEMLPPVSITIFATGVDPDFWRFSIRAYHVLRASPQNAQHNLDRMIFGVTDALDTAGVVSVGPSEWTIVLIPDAGLLLAENNVVIGREDL